MKILKIVGVLIIVLYVLYDLLKPNIEDWRLERKGICTTAVLTPVSIRIKYHKAELKYKFIVNDITYHGNSLEKTGEGDSICVIFLQDNPNINRPLKYFNKYHPINCACEK